MKKSYVYLIALAFASVGHAQAGGFVETTTTKDSPTFMVGITMELGEKATSADVGLTAKVVSSNHEDKFVIGAGVSYFPWTKDPAGQVGLDISAGYNFTNITAMGGYDILRFKPQLSLGYTPTKTKKVVETPSDSRLKYEIKLVAIRDDGLKLYSFKYIWSDETYVGVMAQDLLQDQRWANAVVTQKNGTYAVDYASLGLRMATLEEWQKDGLNSVLVAEATTGTLHKKAA